MGRNAIARPPDAYAYEIKDGRFYWKGERKIAGEALLGPAGGNDEERSSLAKAKEFLLSYLADGPKDGATVQEEAAALLISDRTLKRAKAALDIRSRKGKGKNGSWVWSLPIHLKDANTDDDDSWHSSESPLMEANNDKDANESKIATLPLALN